MSTEQIVALLVAERDRLNTAIAILSVTGTPTITKRRGRPPGKKATAPEAATAASTEGAPASAPSKPARKKRKMSAEARARIAEAQRKRWAATKKKWRKIIAPPGKNTQTLRPVGGQRSDKEWQ